MSEHTNNSNEDSVVSVRTMDIITSTLFLVLGVVVMVGSLKLGASWGSDGPEAGYFPVARPLFPSDSEDLPLPIQKQLLDAFRLKTDGFQGSP